MLPTILFIFIGCFLVERLIPDWRLPQVRAWSVKNNNFKASYFVINEHDVPCLLLLLTSPDNLPHQGLVKFAEKR